MGLRFVGGPYDGNLIDHEQLNAFGSIWPVEASGRTRTFVTTPSKEDWPRLCAGDISPEEAKGNREIYEQFTVAGEMSAEYRHRTWEQFESARLGGEDLDWLAQQEMIPHEHKVA